MMDYNKPYQPNLVYVFADQLRYQSCGYAGDEKTHTPSIDRFASQGVNFCNAISGHPLCAPYRASLFTGKYSSSTGMVINELRMNPSHHCLGHVLHQNGYNTAYIGKWHLWANQLGNHHDPKNSFIPPGPHRLGFDGYWAAYNFHHRYFDTYYHLDSPERIPLKGYEPDKQTESAINWLNNQRDTRKPFALFLSFGTPHDPWDPTNVPAENYAPFRDFKFPCPANYLPEGDPYADQWGRMTTADRLRLQEWTRVYYAMVANLDGNLGRLLQALEQLNLSQDTIVIFTSDHGEMFGAHGRRAKNIFYEEAIRVPFLLRWPGHVPPGSVSDVCLNTPDTMPTLLAMMELPIPAGVEGVNLSHCAYDRPGPEPEAAFLQGMGCTADWVDGHEWRALRDNQYTYAIYHSDHSELLFDHQTDPYQMRNLANEASYHSLLGHFRTMLKKRMEEMGDTFETCTWYRDHWTEDRVIQRSATSDFSRHILENARMGQGK
jgi:arylsulfatase A-like enzyme